MVPPGRRSFATPIAHQRAAALRQRTEGLVCRNRRHGLVDVPRPFELVRRFHLEQVHGMDLAAVRPDRAFAEQRIVGRHRLHRRHNCLAVGRSPDLVDGLQVVEDGGIDAGLHVVRHIALGVARLKALRKGAGRVVRVPIEWEEQLNALRRRQAERPHAVLPHDQRQQLLALPEPELVRLLERIRGIAAGIGERNGFGARALRLHQQGGEVAGPDRVTCRALHLAALLDEFVGELLLQIVPEGIVGSNEEHRLDALAGDGAREPMAIGPGVVGPMHRVGRAPRAGQQRSAGARPDQHLVPVAGDLVDGERDRRVGYVDDHADALVLGPFAGDLGAEIGLVLVIAGHHVDLASGGLAAVVLDRHLRRQQRAGALVVGIDTRHVVEHSDADGVCRCLGGRLGLHRTGQRQTEDGKNQRACRRVFRHLFLLEPPAAALVALVLIATVASGKDRDEVEFHSIQ